MDSPLLNPVKQTLEPDRSLDCSQVVDDRVVQRHTDLLAISEGNISVGSNQSALVPKTMAAPVTEGTRGNYLSESFHTALEDGESGLEQLKSAPTEQSLSPNFTDGQSKIVLAHDGVKDCHAILISKEMFMLMADSSSRKRRVRKFEESIRALYSVTIDAEGRIENLEMTIAALDSLQETPSPIAQEDQDSRQVQRAALSQKMGDASKALQQAVRQIDETEGELNEELQEVNFANGNLVDIFEQAFIDAKITRFGGLNLAGSHSGDPDHLPQESHESLCLSSTDVSVEALNRKATRCELAELKGYVESLQIHFDTRRQRYDRELAKYLQAVANGECALPLSDFDCIQLGNHQRLTGCLIQAEAALKEVRARAVALQIPNTGSQSELEERFVLMYEDGEVYLEDGGYQKTSGPALITGVNRDWIQSWIQNVADSDPGVVLETDEVLVGEHDTLVEISDSVSLVAEGRDRELIDEWVTESRARWSCEDSSVNA